MSQELANDCEKLMVYMKKIPQEIKQIKEELKMIDSLLKTNKKTKNCYIVVGSPIYNTDGIRAPVNKLLLQYLQELKESYTNDLRKHLDGFAKEILEKINKN